MSRELIPARVSSPGRIIEKEIQARGWTQRDLATIMARPVQAINEIIKGNKRITPETAVELGAAFGTSPKFWLNLENNYRLYLAGNKKEALDIEKRGKLYSLLPVREMQRRKWLIESSASEELEAAICAFLGVNDLEEEIPLPVNFHCSPGKEPDLPSKLAWVRRVEHLALQKEVAHFSTEQLLENLPEIIDLSVQLERIKALPEIMAKYGVKFVIVPHLPKTYIDGAAFFLDGWPVVALSLRYDRVDSFWFNLCHELSHILYGHGRSFLDVNLFENVAEETVVSEEEEEANQRASDWLIDSEAYHKFVYRVKPYFSRRSIVEFAIKQRRHPGIILGRLQRDGHVPYANLRVLLKKVSPCLQDVIDQ